MHKNTFIILFFFIVAFSYSVYAQKGESPKRELVWAEEFDYTGQPNPEIWTPEVGRIRNHEAQYYTNRELKNARVQDGYLIIEAHRAEKDTMFTSASITTEGNVEFLRGRLEIRARIPSGVGTWPAIWMLGTDMPSVGWPECGEIDIMENVGYDPYKLHSYAHTTGSRNRPEANISNGTSTIKADAFIEFHVFALEWKEDQLEFYIDDELRFTYKKDVDNLDYWKFDKPHYLLINLAIGGDWGGKKGIDESAFPHRYYIDWIRYYR